MPLPPPQGFQCFRASAAPAPASPTPAVPSRLLLVALTALAPLTPLQCFECFRCSAANAPAAPAPIVSSRSLLAAPAALAPMHTAPLKMHVCVCVCARAPIYRRPGADISKHASPEDTIRTIQTHQDNTKIQHKSRRHNTHTSEALRQHGVQREWQTHNLLAQHARTNRPRNLQAEAEMFKTNTA